MTMYTDDGFDGDVGGVDFARELADGLVRVFVRVGIDVGSRRVGLREQRRRHCAKGAGKTNKNKQTAVK